MSALSVYLGDFKNSPEVELIEYSDRSNWVAYRVTHEKKVYLCHAKVSARPSGAGIPDAKRVSKLDVRENGQALISYDGHWDRRPQDKALLKKVLSPFI